MLLAAGARADDNAQAFHRDLSGRQWVVVSDPAGSYRLRRFDSGGALLGEVSLSSAASDSGFKIASGPGGDAWVAGGTSDGGPVGLGVWRVSADGQTLISSAAVYGSFDIYPGGVAVDASSRAWIAAVETLDAGLSGARFALWRFEADGALSSGFPVFHQRESGVFDGGLSIALDGDGDVWSAGVSSRPAAAAFDLALWRFSPSGVLREGFPVYRGDTFKTLDDLDASLVIAPGGKAWVASSQLFPGCTDQQQALFRFGASGVVELQRYWHNTAETASNSRSIALASDGGPWVLGQSAGSAAVWSYDSFGDLLPGYPRTDSNLFSESLALDAGDAPWVVYGSTPGAFVGAQSVAGAPGLPACAQPPSGTLSGSVIVDGGAPAGSTVAIIASSDGFDQNTFLEIFVSTGGASVPFSISVPTPGDYALGAFLGDDPELIDPSTPIAFYQGFAPVSLAPGGSASGIDFTIAPDLEDPLVAVSFPVSGSTIAALSVIEGTASDANGIDGIDLAVQDLETGLWWDPNLPGWTASGEAIYEYASAESEGTPAAIAWSVTIAGADFGSFAHLDEQLTRGRRYRVLALTGDFVGRESIPAEITFTWNGGQPPPADLSGEALGVSSIAWSWSAVPGATSYFLATSSFTAPFASVSTTSYIDEGLAPSQNRRLCVAAAGDEAVEPYACAFADADPAAPGAPSASGVGTDRVTWSWPSGGNTGDAGYELTISADGFVSDVSTPVAVGAAFKGTSFEVTGLNSDVEYTARVRAYNAGLKLSDYSLAGSTRTEPAGPPAEFFSHGFHRDLTGRQWVVVSGETGAFSLRR
ncbi:MAG: fibronectin type III domain-containing protein, partial [Elusimicrobiota bacterium]|nr:fibronectin type III domain-containing protein [Elusimicrobiota bacterium]